MCGSSSFNGNPFDEIFSFLQVQQVLGQSQEALKKFLPDPEDLARVKDIFTGIYSLDMVRNPEGTALIILATCTVLPACM